MSFCFNSCVRWSCLSRALQRFFPLGRVLPKGLGHVSIPTFCVPEKLERRQIRWILVQRWVWNDRTRNVSCFVVGQSESSHTQLKSKAYKKVSKSHGFSLLSGVVAGQPLERSMQRKSLQARSRSISKFRVAHLYPKIDATHRDRFQHHRNTPQRSHQCLSAR